MIAYFSFLRHFVEPKEPTEFIERSHLFMRLFLKKIDGQWTPMADDIYEGEEEFMDIFQLT